MLPSDVAPDWDCHVHVFDSAASVEPGHYQPQHRPLAAIEALAQSHGFGHLVLVQPSVYGTDNTVLLDALRVQPGRHRGVVVVDASVTDAALADMHHLGVRGVRFNLVSPAGNEQNLQTEFLQLTPRLQALGWHVQWYARPDDLPVIAAMHQRTSVVAVLDHLAGLHAGLSTNSSAWQAVEKLNQCGAFIKLSGWYRLQSEAPYFDLGNQVLSVASMFTNRMIWGSDWPHTSFAADALPGYASMVAPLTRGLTDAQKAHALQSAPKQLYA